MKAITGGRQTKSAKYAPSPNDFINFLTTSQVPPIEGVTEQKTGLLLVRPKRSFLPFLIVPANKTITTTPLKMNISATFLIIITFLIATTTRLADQDLPLLLFAHPGAMASGSAKLTAPLAAAIAERFLGMFFAFQSIMGSHICTLQSYHSMLDTKAFLLASQLQGFDFL